VGGGIKPTPRSTTISSMIGAKRWGASGAPLIAA
jgi:hypothetical protein